MMKYIPNIITCMRFIFIFPILCLLIYPGWGRIVSLSLFIICALSDWLDGYLARKYKAHSTFGQFLDPLVDKFLIMSMFVAFIYADPTVFPYWLVWLIGVREFVITVIRINGVYENKNIHTRMAGKLKTVVQFVAIFIIYALFIIKDQMALNMEIFMKYINTSLWSAAPIWKYVFGVYGTKIVLCLPTVALSIVTAFTLYSGIIYIINNRSFFVEKN